MTDRIAKLIDQVMGKDPHTASPHHAAVTAYLAEVRWRLEELLKGAIELKGFDNNGEFFADPSYLPDAPTHTCLAIDIQPIKHTLSIPPPPKPQLKGETVDVYMALVSDWLQDVYEHLKKEGIR